MLSSGVNSIERTIILLTGISKTRFLSYKPSFFNSKINTEFYGVPTRRKYEVCERDFIGNTEIYTDSKKLNC